MSSLFENVNGSLVLDSGSFLEFLSKELGYNIEKVSSPDNPVLCVSRGLNASFSKNAEEALSQFHQIDIKKELTSILAQEIAEEIKNSGEKITHFYQISAFPYGNGEDTSLRLIIRGAFE